MPMAIIHWKHPVTGDFAVAANWNPATVPGASDTAAIDAASLTAYTVGATTGETVNNLTTVANATLSITGGFFTISNGTRPADWTSSDNGHLIGYDRPPP